jgi:two-component sensor histidine kinase
LQYINGYQIAAEQEKEDLYINFKNGLHHYSYDAADEIMFNGNEIIATSMVQAHGSGVWVGTQDGQLLKIVDGVITSSKQFPSNFNEIVQWKNILFLADKNRVYRYEITSDTISLLDKTDGLLEEKIVNLYVQQDTLLILGGNSIQKIPCSYNETNHIPPVLRIEKVYLFDQEKELDDLDFAYNENNITFHFSTTSIRSQGKHVYQYRLNDGAWIETGAQAPLARFTKLAAGAYKFEVRALNEDGIQSEIESVSFNIAKHFTRTWWFISAVTFVLGLLLLVLIRNRVKRVQKRTQLAIEQQQMKAELYKSKIAAIRAQMNPHFMFNALNSIQAFIMTNQEEVASNYLAEFAGLMRKYLNQSRFEEISLSDEIETLGIYLKLESLRTDGALKYTMECDSKLNSDEIEIPIMLLQPHIENAIKHGLMHKEGEKKLSVSFNRINDELMECVIEDNGIGRQASAEINKRRQRKPESFATKSIDQKMNLVNNNSSRSFTIEIIDLVEGDIGVGTRVVIRLSI